MKGTSRDSGNTSGKRKPSARTLSAATYGKVQRHFWTLHQHSCMFEGRLLSGACRPLCLLPPRVRLVTARLRDGLGTLAVVVVGHPLIVSEERVFCIGVTTIIKRRRRSHYPVQNGPQKSCVKARHARSRYANRATAGSVGRKAVGVGKPRTLRARFVPVCTHKDGSLCVNSPAKAAADCFYVDADRVWARREPGDRRISQRWWWWGASVAEALVVADPGEVEGALEASVVVVAGPGEAAEASLEEAVALGEVAVVSEASVAAVDHGGVVVVA
ncbi:hypothetical protein MRX96_009793 [Rhipicephalus microplus]